MENNNKLADDLKKHLKKHFNDKNFWSRDVIGLIIKDFCEGRGNFKNSPRGNPRKGYNKMMENLNNNS